MLQIRISASFFWLVFLKQVVFEKHLKGSKSAEAGIVMYFCTTPHSANTNFHFNKISHLTQKKTFL